MCLACVDLFGSLSLRLPLFCLNDPSKNDIDAVDWRSLLARSTSRAPRANGTLLSRLDFAGRSILYIRTDESRASYFRGSVRKRGTGRNGIPVYGFVTRDRSYETTGISRGGRVDEKDRRRGREGTARDTQRSVGIICTSLGWRWLGLVGTCAMAVVLCTDRAQSICRRTRDYEFFPTNTRFTTNIASTFLLSDNTVGI